MLYCGIQKNVWVERALRYLPDDIFDQIDGKIAITVLESDACRLASKISNKEEIIVLSPWIFSYIPSGSKETDKECRYFIFSILHELAHAIYKHSPPDEISGIENNRQEDEANSTALTWFNQYVSDNSTMGLIPLNMKEIKQTQKVYKMKTEKMLISG